MVFLKSILNEIKSIFTLYVLVLFIATAAHSFFVESKNLEARKLKKETKFARIIGVIYMVTGIALYLVSRYL